MLRFCKLGSFGPISTNLSQELNNRLLLKPSKAFLLLKPSKVFGTTLGFCLSLNIFIL